MKYTLLLAAVAGCCSVASAQTLNLFKPTDVVAVEKGAHTMSAPFCGGFNAPQFSTADLNNDGKMDLVTFEGGYGRSGVKTFINRGAPGNPSYEYAPQYAQNFPPDVFNYLILRDYNRDGIADLFHAGLGGFSVYKGYFSGQMLRFEYVKELNYQYIANLNTGALDSANAYVGNSCIPGIEDVDGDGDLDFLSFSIQGARILYYQNRQEEDGLPKDTIRLHVRHGCWGNALQGSVRSYLLGVDSANCPLESKPAPGPTPNGNPNSQTRDNSVAAKGQMHGSNALAFFDADGDGDIDLLNGNGGFNDIQFLRNGRMQYGTRNDTLVAQDTLWQSAGTIYEQSSYPAAFPIDFNNDGKRDILIAPHGSGRDRNQIWYYQNNGTATAPQFVLTTDSLLSNDVMDIGSHSRPLFYDYNKDGKPDLLVGGLEMLSNGQQLSRLHYYENITTTVGQPRFQYKTSDLVNLSILSVYVTDPAVGDADGDGKDDLVIGGSDGNLLFFQNTAASASAQPVWILQQQPMKRDGTNPLNVFSYASPAFYDINKDGKPDLVLGQNNGSLKAYLNTNTTPGVVSFGPATDSLGGAYIPNLGTQAWPFRRSRPFVGKLQEGSNQDYLLMGSYYGVLGVWDNVGTGNVAQPFSKIADTFSNLVFTPDAAPAVADVDGDGKLEMVVGTDIGGLQLFWTGTGLDTYSSLPQAAYLKVFPNPADGYFKLLRQGVSGKGTTTITVSDVTGRLMHQEIWSAGRVAGEISTQGWPSGMYLLQVAAEEGIKTQKIQVIH